MRIQSRPYTEVVWLMTVTTTLLTDVSFHYRVSAVIRYINRRFTYLLNYCSQLVSCSRPQSSLAVLSDSSSPACEAGGRLLSFQHLRTTSVIPSPHVAIYLWLNRKFSSVTSSRIQSLSACDTFGHVEYSHFSSVQRRSPGVMGVLTPKKYVGRVRVCLTLLKCRILLFKTVVAQLCRFHIIKNGR